MPSPKLEKIVDAIEKVSDAIDELEEVVLDGMNDESISDDDWERVVGQRSPEDRSELGVDRHLLYLSKMYSRWMKRSKAALAALKD